LCGAGYGCQGWSAVTCARGLCPKAEALGWEAWRREARALCGAGYGCQGWSAVTCARGLCSKAEALGWEAWRREARALCGAGYGYQDGVLSRARGGCAPRLKPWVVGMAPRSPEPCAMLVMDVRDGVLSRARGGYGPRLKPWVVDTALRCAGLVRCWLWMSGGGCYVGHSLTGWERIAWLKFRQSRTERRVEMSERAWTSQPTQGFSPGSGSMTDDRL